MGASRALIGNEKRSASRALKIYGDVIYGIGSASHGLPRSLKSAKLDEKVLARDLK